MAFYSKLSDANTASELYPTPMSDQSTQVKI